MFRRALVRYAVPVLLVAATVLFAAVYGQSYPVDHWLFWHYSTYWLSAAYFSLACVSAGYAVVRRLRRTPWPLVETLAVSFSTGIVVEYLAMNVLGAFHALYWPVFFLLPAAMIAVGGAPLYRLLRRSFRHFKAARARSTWSPSVWTILACLFGLTVLGMIYFKILTPNNVQFDARWKHLALAEEFAHVHAMPRYGEGWTVATNPHLASIVYLWGFLLPGGNLFDHVELSAHLEYVCLLWTLVGVVALVRRLVPRHRVGMSWAALFLFPGILLYDSSLSCGADHVSALFAAPVVLTLLRALDDLSPRQCSLLGLQFAGAALPKLTSGMYLVPGPAIVLGAAVVVRFVRRRKLEWKGLVVGAAVALAGTAFFWLRNWIWYGDPVYPSLHGYLHLRPWTPQAKDLFVWGYKNFQFWRPARNLHGVIQTLKALVTFSFIPHDYRRFHGTTPVFGSLFTLLLVVLPFFKKTRRIWGVVAMVESGIFIWYWIHHQDRYLQTLTPLMAAVVAAIVIKVWQTHLVNRAAVALLIATQIVIGGDVYFFETHAMIGAPIKVVNDLLQSGFRKQYQQRFDVFSGWVAVRNALPEKAHVLLHDTHTHLGLARRTTNDWGGWQFGISYSNLLTPRKVWEKYRQLGVTHLVWQERVSKGWDNVTGDLVFFDFAFHYTVNRRRVGVMWIGRMPDKPPPDKPAGRVALFGCNDMYHSGLYELGSLNTPVFGPDKRMFAPPMEAATPANEASLIDKAAFVVIDPVCASREAAMARRRHFRLVADRTMVNTGLHRRVRPWQLYLR